MGKAVGSNTCQTQGPFETFQKIGTHSFVSPSPHGSLLERRKLFWINILCFLKNALYIISPPPFLIKEEVQHSRCTLIMHFLLNFFTWVLFRDFMQGYWMLGVWSDHWAPLVFAGQPMIVSISHLSWDNRFSICVKGQRNTIWKDWVTFKICATVWDLDFYHSLICSQQT